LSNNFFQHKTVMSVKRALYGTQVVRKDVTSLVNTLLARDGFVVACNQNFGDPCPNRVKKLFITLANNRTVAISEGSSYPVAPSPISHLQSQSQLQSITFNPAVSKVVDLSNVKLTVFYHIFANAGTAILDIFEDQVKTLLECPILDKIVAINCCLTGNHAENYHKIAQRIAELGSAELGSAELGSAELGSATQGKFRLYKTVFGDTTAEKFTFNAIKDSELVSSTPSSGGVAATTSDDDSFILYLHSKGVTNNCLPVWDWRKCMEYFLITKADHTISRLVEEKANSAGPFYQPGMYAGNFWWARCSFLRRLFAKHPIGRGNHVSHKRGDPNSDYLVCEQYIFKEPHKFINLYPQAKTYHGYLHRLPLAAYAF